MRSLPASLTIIKAGYENNKWTAIGAPFRVRWQREAVYKCVCRCQCGTVSAINAHDLKSGRSKDCGCGRKISVRARQPRKTHGKSKTPLYKVWIGMKERCQYQKHMAYDNYGGRGIKVCEAWDTSFEAFETWAMVNGWKQGLEIDRRENEGNYEPSNCRIVTSEENSNNKRQHAFYEAWGESKTTWQWSKDPRCMVIKALLRKRLGKGWSAEEAIATPKISKAGRRVARATRGGLV